MAARGLTYWPTGSVVRCAPKAPTMCRTFGMLTSNRPGHSNRLVINRWP